MRKLKFSFIYTCITLSLIFCNPLLINAKYIYPTTQDIQSCRIKFYDLTKKADKEKLEGNFENAYTLYSEALQLAQKNLFQEDTLYPLLQIANIYWNLGEIELSENSYSSIIKKAIEIKNKEFEQLAYSFLQICKYYLSAKALRAKGLYQESIENFSKAISISREIQSKEHELKCLRQQSLNFLYLEKLDDYLSLNREALLLANYTNNKREQAYCLNNIGLYYWKADNYTEALQNYEKAYSIAKRIGDLEGEAEYLSNIGIAYYDLGEFEKALEILNEALSIDKKIGNEISICKSLNNIGEVYRRKGFQTANRQDVILAISYFEQALNVSHKTGDNETEIRILNNLATAYSYLNETSKSISYFVSALAAAGKLDNHEIMGMIYNNLGIVYAQMGNYEESTKYYQKAIDLALGIKGARILWEAYLELANTKKKQNEFAEALKNYEKSISVIENIRSGINLEEYKASFLGTDKRIEPYHNIIDLYIKLDQRDHKKEYQERAFHYLEKAKARAFLDSIEVSKVDITKGVSQMHLNQEAELMNEISKVHTKLLQSQLAADQRQELNGQLEQLEQQLESLRRTIRNLSPGYSNLRYPRTIELKEAQKDLLDEETAFFAYVLTQENSYAFVLTKNNLEIFALPERKIIQNQVREYLKCLTDPGNEDFHMGFELFRELVQPGLKRRIQNIVVVPDDILYFLPFETLLTQKGKKDWLINNYNVSYVPSLSSLRELIERERSSPQRPRKDLLAFGDPFFGGHETDPLSESSNNLTLSDDTPIKTYFPRLRYSGKETEKISSLFPSSKRDVFQRHQASEDILKRQNLSSYRIIHFATHAIIDDKKPGRSAIVLSLDQDPREDGLLQMREIFNLKLSADLVTLSACQTGLGQLIRGEGIEGLSRAFFSAGASSVLLSLWSIHDQASYQLLERFYFHLRSSHSIADALRKAKLEMINSQVLDHPYYWGGFIISGDADKVIFPRRLNKWAVVTLSLCAGLAFLLIIMNRDRILPLGLIRR